MTATATKSSLSCGAGTMTAGDGTRASPRRRPPSRGEQVLVWTFGILELFLDLTSASLNATRERVRVIRRVTSGEGGTESVSRRESPLLARSTATEPEGPDCAS
jgi:hypothetical protein